MLIGSKFYSAIDLMQSQHLEFIKHITYTLTLHSLRYEENEFDEALGLYLNALPVFEEVSNVDPIVGDIHVKICTILQGIGEFSLGISHLTKAKDAYTAAHGEATDDHIKSILIQNIINVSVESGDAYLAMGEMDKASECYEVS